MTIAPVFLLASIYAVVAVLLLLQLASRMKLVENSFSNEISVPND